MQTDRNGGISDLNHEQREDDFNTFRGKKVKMGIINPPRTEVNSPREGTGNYLQDPKAMSTSTIPDLGNSNTNKVTLLSQIKPPGPGSYNHHLLNEFGAGLRKEYYSNKKISFGSNEPRKFTINRSMESPFVEPTKIDNPPSWKY